MKVRSIAVSVLLVSLLALAGCASGAPDGVNGDAEPLPTGPAAGSRLAPGLYDLEGGSVQAVGTLEWVDLEGGFWAVIGGTQSEGNVGETVAVIANGSEFADELESLEGSLVSLIGQRLDGASIRMAGPEIEMESVEEMSDTPGAAE